MHIKRPQRRELPDGPVVKNPPSSAGGVSLIPGRGTKIPHQRARTLQQEKPAQQRGHMLQPRPSTVKIYKQFFKDHKGYVAILKPSHSFPPYSS